MARGPCETLGDCPFSLLSQQECDNLKSALTTERGERRDNEKVIHERIDKTQQDIGAFKMWVLATVVASSLSAVTSIGVGIVLYLITKGVKP